MTAIKQTVDLMTGTIIRLMKAQIEPIAIDLARMQYPDLRKAGPDFRGGQKGSFWLKGDGSGFFDHETGEGGDAITLAQRVHGLSFRQVMALYLGDQRSVRTYDNHSFNSGRPTEIDLVVKKSNRKHQAGRRIFDRATMLSTLGPSHLIHEYLAFRGLESISIDTLSEDLRFAEVWGKPALVCAIRSPHFDTYTRSWPFLGIHVTFLDPHTGGNAKDERGNSERIQYGTSGQVNQRVIFPTWRSQPETLVQYGRLGLAEGLEDALHLSRTRDAAPCWSTLDAGNMAKLKPVQGIDTLEINEDNDCAGKKAANTLASRWAAAGCSVKIFTPKSKDFAQSLQQVV